MIPAKFAAYIDPSSVALGLLLSGLVQLLAAFFLATATAADAATAVAVVGLATTTLSAVLYAVHLHVPEAQR